MIYTLTRVDEETLAEIREEKNIRKTEEVFLLFPLGSQFDHLIKQALEKLGVFCIVADSAQIKAEDVRKLSPKGIILSGGPVSVYKDPPPFDEEIFDLGIPVLGICLGFQLWAKHIGCTVTGSEKREFGVHKLTILDQKSPLLGNCAQHSPVLESHGDVVDRGHAGIIILGETENSLLAAANFKHLWGTQFHPEVTDTKYGEQIFSNFCFGICGAKDKYPAEKIAEKKIADLKAKIGSKKVLLALSGGSDSSTVAYLLRHATEGNKGQVRGIYIKGIDRPDDEKHVLECFGKADWIEVKIVDAAQAFLRALQGKVSMREKRIAMREVYKTVLEDEAKTFGADFIAQGTLYTDISESGHGYNTGAKKAQIKLHHNCGLNFSVGELTPLVDCVKDNGRNIGRIIGVPEDLLTRHPFPGPGLVVRIEGEVNSEKLQVARKLDDIYIVELRKWNLYDTIWQAGAVVTKGETTCTKGDDAASGYIVLLWAVWSVNGFTAQFAELPWDFLRHVSRRMTNEIREVGAVSYRVSDKPPATIEIG